MKSSYRFRKQSKQQRRKLNVDHSSSIQRKEYKVEPLVADTVRPLVDLAYWSSFVEVRRDCAAAFATLSMNCENLEVLSRSGCLGAVLALICHCFGINSGMVVGRSWVQV